MTDFYLFQTQARQYRLFENGLALVSALTLLYIGRHGQSNQGRASQIQTISIARAPRPPKNPVAPTIGIIGGGQLAKMLGQAASQLGLQTIVLSEQPHCPAASSVTRVIQGRRRTRIAARTRRSLRSCHAGKRIRGRESAWKRSKNPAIPSRPSAATMRVVQDKFLQKTALKNAGLSVPEFIDVPDLAALRRCHSHSRLAACFEKTPQRLRWQRQCHHSQRSRCAPRMGTPQWRRKRSLCGSFLPVHAGTRHHDHARHEHQERGVIRWSKPFRIITSAAPSKSRRAYSRPRRIEVTVTAPRKAIDAVQGVGTLRRRTISHRRRSHPDQRTGPARSQLRPLHHRSVRLFAIRKSSARDSGWPLGFARDALAGGGDDQPTWPRQRYRLARRH